MANLILYEVFKRIHDRVDDVFAEAPILGDDGFDRIRSAVVAENLLQESGEVVFTIGFVTVKGVTSLYTGVTPIRQIGQVILLAVDVGRHTV